MSYFLGDSASSNIITENQLSVLLLRFDTDYIFDIIRYNMGNRFNCYVIQMPNIVAAYEQDFKQLKNEYQEEGMIRMIDDVREQTYKGIINLLCTSFNLQFITDDIHDYYSAAFVLYSVLVSDFRSNMINFFTNFITREKNGLYDSLGLAEFKKSKDSATLYNKKLYKNGKLAVINANLEYVLDSICNFDIVFENLLNTTFSNTNYVKYLLSTIVPIQDFFKTIYVPVLMGAMRPVIITDIRLNIQKLSIVDDVNIDDLQ